MFVKTPEWNSFVNISLGQIIKNQNGIVAMTANRFGIVPKIAPLMRRFN